MVRKLSLILFTVLVVALVSFVFLYNQAPVTVTYRPGHTMTAQLALVLIYAFSLGVLVSMIVAFFMGAKVRLHNRQLQRQLKLSQEHLGLIEEARGQLALGDSAGAQVLLTRIMQRDPDNIMARIELAETHEQQNDPAGALRILDQSRIEQKKNVELLLKASRLNAAQGNHTAAYDNAAMVLQLKPRSRFALERVVCSCVQLGRIDEAMQYQQELVKTLSGEDYNHALAGLATLELRRAVRDAQPSVPTVGSASTAGSTDRLPATNTERADLKKLRTGLEKVLRNHRDFPPALNLLAEVELEDGNLEGAVKLWKKLFALTLKADALESIAVAYLKRDKPAQAVGAVRSTLDSVPDRSAERTAERLVDARLFLIQLLIHLEMLEDADAEFAKLPSTLAVQPTVAGPYAVVRAQLLRKKGKSEEAFVALTQQALPISSPLGQRLSVAAGGGSDNPDWSKRLERSLLPPKQQRSEEPGVYHYGVSA